MNDLAAQLNYDMIFTVNDSMHRKFEHFRNFFNNVINSHAPQKLATRKEKNDESKFLVNLRYSGLNQNKKQNV